MTVGVDDIDYILVAFDHPVYILFLRISDLTCISFYDELKKESLGENFTFSHQG